MTRRKSLVLRAFHPRDGTGCAQPGFRKIQAEKPERILRQVTAVSRSFSFVPWQQSGVDACNPKTYPGHDPRGNADAQRIANGCRFGAEGSTLD
eukprot:1824886-Amphidinium_carterae.2